MKRRILLLGTLFLQVFFLFSLHAQEEFSTPRDFSEFESNTGVQQIVDVVRPWVGLTPQEIAPGSVPLGSLKYKTYVPEKKLSENREPLLELEPVKKKKEIPLPQEENYPLEVTGDPVPVKNSAPGWVGPLPSELAPEAIPLGSLVNRRVIKRVPKSEPVEQKIEDSRPVQQAPEKPLNASIFISTRPYYTYNVLRVDNGDEEAGVWENLIGASLFTKSFPMGNYITFVPRLDLMMQVASYEDKEVQAGGQNLKDLLGYRFALAKAGFGLNFPKEFSLNLGYEYNLLNSLNTGDKMFDALVPSLRLSKIFTLGQTTLLMVDASARYSATDRELPNPLPGQFPDDGDNLQFGLNFMLIQLFGSEGQFMLMPSLNVSRSEYLNHTNDGRVDLSTTLGLNGSWQATDWLSLDLGVNWTVMRMNDLGKVLQGPSSKYQAFDIGGSLTASHSF